MPFLILSAAFLCGCSYTNIGQDSRVLSDGRFRVATALTDRGSKHVADAHLGGRDIHLCPGEIFSRTFSFPVSAGDTGTWAAWLFLEDIRTDGTNAQPGIASVQVIFDGTHSNTVYFSNQGGWAGPYFSFLPWADTSVTHTVAILNTYTNCIWIGDVFSRWAVNARTNSANMHVVDALIATNIQIPTGGPFRGSAGVPGSNRRSRHMGVLVDVRWGEDRYGLSCAGTVPH
jgi:hypothetical protein